MPATTETNTPGSVGEVYNKDSTETDEETVTGKNPTEADAIPEKPRFVWPPTCGSTTHVSITDAGNGTKNHDTADM